MLYFSRWTMAAILAIPLVLCLAAVPNFLPKQAFDNLPVWAQRKITLGWDVQGGARVQLQVNEGDVHGQALRWLQDEVRRTVREARIGLVSAPVIRGNSVEVAIREGDLRHGLEKLKELTLPLDAVVYVQGRVPASVPDTASAAASSL